MIRDGFIWRDKGEQYMKKAIQLWKQAGYPYTETKEGCFHVSDQHLQELPALSSRHIWIYEDGSFWAYEVGWSDDMDMAITFTKEMTTALLYTLSVMKTKIKTRYHNGYRVGEE